MDYVREAHNIGVTADQLETELLAENAGNLLELQRRESILHDV